VALAKGAGKLSVTPVELFRFRELVDGEAKLAPEATTQRAMRARHELSYPGPGRARASGNGSSG